MIKKGATDFTVEFELVKSCFTLMRFIEVHFWTFRNDSGGINCFVAVVVMLFDVLEVYGLLNSGLLVKITCISVEFRIVTNPAQVGFEV